MVEIRIVPLTKEILRSASTVADRVFQGEFPKPSHGLAASLEAGLTGKIVRRVATLLGYRDIQYWVAVDEQENVLGLTGLYDQRKEQRKVKWVGWHCVAPEARGQGIGEKLLDHVIQEARSAGANALRLYTSTHGSEAAAQSLYEKRGLKVVEQGPEIREGQEKYRYLYRQLLLNSDETMTK